MKLFCDMMSFNRTQGTRAADTVGLKLPDDYLYWVLVFRSDAIEGQDFARRPHALSPQQSAEKSQELTAHWHPRIRAILSEQDPSAASSLTFLAADPRSLASNWASQPRGSDASVTLLGDAAHPMPPVGWFGANAAFIDAAALCDRRCQSLNIYSISIQ